MYTRITPLPLDMVKNLGLQPVTIVHGIGDPGFSMLINITGWEDGEPYVQCKRCKRKVSADTWAEVGCTSDECLIREARKDMKPIRGFPVKDNQGGKS